MTRSHVAKWLTAEKERRGLTFVEWARLLKKPLASVHDWTTGKYEPTLPSLRHIAKRLDCEVTEIVGEL